jgi:3-oxoacyl-[acyl-carrier-protein] synthase-3
VTDAEFVDFFRLEFCGSAAACVPDPDRNLGVDPAYQVYRYFQDDPDGLVAWAAEVDRRIVDAVDGACRQAGIRREDLDRLILLNDSQPSMDAVARSAGLPIERTNARLSSLLGHFGGADPLVCLSLYRDDGLLAAGDLVALAGLSSGMHWFCTLVEV